MRPREETISICDGEYSIPVTKCLAFYSHRKRSEAEQEEDARLGLDRRVFSNLWSSAVRVPSVSHHMVGESVPSVEHAFQICKCLDASDARFMASLSPDDAAAYGQGRMRLKPKDMRRFASLGVDTEGNEGNFEQIVENAAAPSKNRWTRRHARRPDWEAIKMQAMFEALADKFGPDSELAVHLKATAGMFLVEHTRNDRNWADAGDGSGSNHLGKMLVLLRDGGDACDVSRLGTFLRAPNSELVAYDE